MVYCSLDVNCDCLGSLKPWSNGFAKVASWKLGSTCDSVWPGLACTYNDLRSLWSRSNCKSMQVFYRLAAQRKSLRKFNLPLFATTCESVWTGLKVAVKPVSTIKISIGQYKKKLTAIFPYITRCMRTTRCLSTAACKGNFLIRNL